MNGFSENAGLILMLPVIMCLVLPLAMLAAYGVLHFVKMVFDKLETLGTAAHVETAKCSPIEMSRMTEKTSQA